MDASISYTNAYTACVIVGTGTNIGSFRFGYVNKCGLGTITLHLSATKSNA